MLGRIFGTLALAAALATPTGNLLAGDHCAKTAPRGGHGRPAAKSACDHGKGGKCDRKGGKCDHKGTRCDHKGHGKAACPSEARSPEHGAFILGRGPGSKGPFHLQLRLNHPSENCPVKGLLDQAPPEVKHFVRGLCEKLQRCFDKLHAGSHERMGKGARGHRGHGHLGFGPAGPGDRVVADRFVIRGPKGASGFPGKEAERFFHDRYAEFHPQFERLAKNPEIRKLHDRLMRDLGKWSRNARGSKASRKSKGPHGDLFAGPEAEEALKLLRKLHGQAGALEGIKGRANDFAQQGLKFLESLPPKERAQIEKLAKELFRGFQGKDGKGLERFMKSFGGDGRKDAGKAKAQALPKKRSRR